MKFGIIGCGLVGQKRLRALSKNHRLLAAADAVPERARAVAQSCSGAVATSNWEELLTTPQLDAVIVSTTNDWLAPIALAAVQSGKHVLLEKPAARVSEELDPVIEAAERGGVAVQIGFNHRYHPAVRKAHEMAEQGAIGPLMFIRGRYGHGGRVGYEREWRAQPEKSGGGELIDQGVHLIDLARWFLGDFTGVEGHLHTYFWNMPVEDNAFLSLRTADQRTAWLHASCTEWKNLFSFEIYGRQGKLHIEGLGGSYGTERLSYYQMLPEMGPPRTTIWEFPGEDVSWENELEDFSRCLRNGKNPATTLRDAKAVLDVLKRLYQPNTSAN